MKPFDPNLPVRTKQGQYKAHFVSKRRGPSGGLIFKLEGYGTPGANSTYAFRNDGTLFGTDGSPFDLENYELEKKD